MTRAALFITAACLSATAAGQATHHGYIWVEGPMEVLQADTTYTLEVWGRFESPWFIAGESMIGGFGIDVLNTGGGQFIASVSNVRIEAWAEPFGTVGVVQGHDVVGTAGGQIPFFDFPPEPPTMANPERLFSFDVRTASGPLGVISFGPANPNPNGGLSFYPNPDDGVIVLIPNDADTALHLSGWASTVPASGGAFVLAAAWFGRRGRR